MYTLIINKPNNYANKIKAENNSQAHTQRN